jgi:polysaccharide deacetylase family protein (PEP-CTERM system associated)
MHEQVHSEPRPPARSGICHMLSFDVEEYFHAEAFRDVIGPTRWSAWPSRIEAQMDGLLSLLSEANIRATFFVLGALARHHGRLVQRIAAGGHEIACHGDSHEMIARLGVSGFRDDTAAAKARLEDLVGQRVLGYRAATFGLVRATAWAIDVLTELGFCYDSSIQPVYHDRYGVPDAPPHAHWAIGPGGSRILELPPMTRRLAGRNIPLGGGGYFRLLPAVFFDRALRALARRGQSAMLYLHPWEFDPDQPVVPAGRLRNFRHRVNLRRTPGKLRALLAAHQFGRTCDVAAELTAQNLPSFQYLAVDEVAAVR